MILRHSESVTRQAMTMPGAKNVAMQLLCGPGDGCPNFAMRKFTVAPGGETPKHQHDYEHEVYILAGDGVAFGNGAENAVHAGDSMYVPANELHQFRNTGAEPLVFICLVPAFVHQAGGPAAAAPPQAVDCSK